MPEELSEQEYKKISIKLHKMLILYKNEQINEEQVIEKIFDYFFITK